MATVGSLSDLVVLASLDCAHKHALKFRFGNRRSYVGAPWERKIIMAIEVLIIWLVIGAIAGWLLPQIGFVVAGGILATILNAVIGAVILLLVIGLVRRAA